MFWWAIRQPMLMAHSVKRTSCGGTMPYPDVDALYALYEALAAKIQRWRQRHGRPPQCAFVPASAYEELRISGFTRIAGVPLLPSPDGTVFLSPDGATKPSPARRPKLRLISGGSRR